MPRAISDADYEYRPWSIDRRERASALAKRRLGAPAGHSTVYGAHVPDRYVDKVREAATKIAAREGRVAAASFVKQSQRNGWRLPSRVARPFDHDITGMWLRGRTVQAIADSLVLTKGQVAGVIWRSGLSRNRRFPPAGHSEVPRSQVASAVARTYYGDDRGPDDADRSFRYAVLCVSPMFVEPWPSEMKRWAGYAIKDCIHVHDVMRRNRLWWNGRMSDPDRYMEDGMAGCVALALDVGLCEGKLARMMIRGEEHWGLPERAAQVSAPRTQSVGTASIRG